MRPSSSTSEKADGSPPGGLLQPLFGDPGVDAAIDDGALVAAMLRFERELAAAQADLGLIPAEAAVVIGRTADELVLDPTELGRTAPTAGNPANPLVQALRVALPEPARSFVHLGTTSQDVLDSALMLVAKQACGRIRSRLNEACDALLRLIAAHRATPMPARTLGQQALPTTVGRVAAGWLVALDEAAARLQAVAEERLAVQLGGAAGTLAGLDGRGPELVTLVAARLDLADPTLPWHTDRLRLLDLAGALGGVVATSGKVALDLVLLAQSEVAEMVPAVGGGSTAMPHKQNPVDAILVRSAAVRAPGLVATLFSAAAAQENERSAGGWHAEWEPLRQLLSLTGGAAQRLAVALGSLRVDAERMRADLELSGGLLYSESVAARLAPALGREAAHELVAECARRAGQDGVDFGEILRDEPRVRAVLDEPALGAALTPGSGTESTDALVDRALEAHARRAGGVTT